MVTGIMGDTRDTAHTRAEHLIVVVTLFFCLCSVAAREEATRDDPFLQKRTIVTSTTEVSVRPR